MSEPRRTDECTDDVPGALGSVLGDYPVRLAVLFGSGATGELGPGSDVDVAVEFEAGLSRTERNELRFELLSELMAAVGRDEVDLTEIGDFDPVVGREALASCVVLVGSDPRAEYHHEAFERLAAEVPSFRERADRVLAGLSR
jgi:predicted nucleotidyltransferase